MARDLELERIARIEQQPDASRTALRAVLCITAKTGRRWSDLSKITEFDPPAGSPLTEA
jgi:hypothetical protein